MIVIRKVSDIEELELRAKLPDEVYKEVCRIARILDELYGEQRSAESDGGIIIVAEKKKDLKTIKTEYASLNESDCEGEDIITTPKGNYVNQFYLSNNEFGVNVILPEKFFGRMSDA